MFLSCWLVFGVCTIIGNVSKEANGNGSYKKLEPEARQRLTFRKSVLGARRTKPTGGICRDDESENCATFVDDDTESPKSQNYYCFAMLVVRLLAYH